MTSLPANIYLIATSGRREVRTTNENYNDH